jgi:hypothetical protein
MEFDEPVVELDEFYCIDLNRKGKLPPTDPEYTRKRSYSKEDVKIGLNVILDTGHISPEFVISDEDEYAAEQEQSAEERMDNLRAPKCCPSYRKSMTGNYDP